MSKLFSLEKDLRAIDAVNKHDVEFALANDADLMMSQWTDDIVVLQPEAPILRGRAAIAEVFRSVERPEIVDYLLDIQEVTVLGDHAFQRGTYRYSMRPRSGGEAVQTSGKIMRILQRQRDGTWKIHRTMATVENLNSARPRFLCGEDLRTPVLVFSAISAFNRSALFYQPVFAPFSCSSSHLSSGAK
jgi:uncharacterized protein (TIGR02246 family)